MANDPVLSVLLLWHQHQPFYKDPLSDRYELPWVRLHAIKDYYDMVAILEEFPKIRLNFNLVPSLLAQLDDYGQGRAQERFLTLSTKPAADLSFDDRLFLLNNFFMANWDTMIDPNPRYRELLDKRGRHVHDEELSRIQNYFKEQDWRDLQVWFNLAWFDPYWVEKDEFIRKLREKGKGFTETDKRKLIEKQLKICGEVASKHKEYQDKGQIEITATPFYHPILPLLCDREAAKMAMPNATLPQQRFSYPEDAQAQIERAMVDHETRFGRRPRGMWPSEGSVSEATADILIDRGVRWIATDEGILANSLPPAPFIREDIYEPYRLERGGKSISMFFRDHELSDAIGFVYTTWDATDAVNDFMKRLQGIRARLKEQDGETPRSHIVPVILDGENCWEYYREDGRPFLRQLYQALSDEPGIETVLGADYLEKHPPTRSLSKLWSGSWINSNFAIWIGHKEDNTAWDLLYRTRQFLTHYLKSNPQRADSPEAKLAWESIYIAEGSDWCWWYGDDHSSANDAAFDYLFRKHLMNVYTAVGAKVPEDLRVPIKPKRIKAVPKPPIDFITPKIDGKVTSYFEWQSAGVYETNPGGTGTMHRADNVVKTFHYGYDLYNLYFRIDLARPLAEIGNDPLNIKIVFIKPEAHEALFTYTKETGAQLQIVKKTPGKAPEHRHVPMVAATKILEFGIPLNHFTTPPGPFEWILTVEKDGQEQERWPSDSAVTFPYPAEENFAQSWTL
jgi:alpha-amylase/alpha-mannosidase (GH57 family)